MNDGALVELRHVTCAYGPTVVVDHVDLQIRPGEFVGIVGPSGAGKTTLLKALLGAVRPVEGQVGRATGVRMASVPQLETVDWNFPVTVAEVVAMSLTPAHRWWPRISAAERGLIDATLERLGLAGLGARHIRELSGGQQQRVFLARALVQQPDLLVLDEPTAGIDVRTRHEVLHVLADLNEAPPAGQGIAVVLTTHDLNGLAAHLPRLVCFNRTVVADGSPRDVLTSDVLERTYGAPMEVLAHGGLPVVLEHGDELLRARLRKLSA